MHSAVIQFFFVLVVETAIAGGNQGESWGIGVVKVLPCMTIDMQI